MAMPFTKKAFEEHPKPAPGEPSITKRRLGAKYQTVTFTSTGISLGIAKTYKGTLYKKVLCHWPEVSISDYEKMVNQLVSDIETGKYQRESNITLDQFVKRYVLPEIKKKNRDVKGFIKRYKPIKKRLGKRGLIDIDLCDANKVEKKLARNRAGSTVNRHMSALSRIMTEAVKLGFRTDNPCSLVERRKEAEPCKRILSDQEIFYFIEAVDLIDTFPAYALKLSLYTGLRIGNVTDIARDMLNDDNTALTLPMTKNGKSYTVQLNEPARETIQYCLNRSWNQYVFPSAIKEGRHITYPQETYQRIRKYVAEKTGITDHWTIHDLRRTFASRQLKLTGDIRLVQQSLFHSSVAVTERYCYHEDAALAAASEATAQSLLGNPTDSIQQQETRHAG